VDFIEKISTLKRIDRLIRLRATGRPSEFAEKMGISERSLYNYLSRLKQLGANIRFNECCNSYEYPEDGNPSGDLNFSKK